MWLPTPIYERTPQLWLLVAALFVVLALYIGFTYRLTFFYLSLGVFCAVRGLHIMSMRRKYRGAGSTESGSDDDRVREAARN